MKECAVVVPIYKLPLPNVELYVLERNLRTLKGWPVIFVLPKKLLPAWEQNQRLCQSGDTECFPDKFFESIDGYNELLLDIRFYWRFRSFRNILVCQLDALVVHDELRFWCDTGYSYIGAPWLDGYGTPSVPYKFLGVGNGGLSLRRVAHFLRLLAVPRRIYTAGGSPRLIEPSRWVFVGRKLRGPKVQEDTFWSLMRENYSWFTTPDPLTALKFSFEVAPRYLFELNGHKMPFGGHAWEKYDPGFWLEQIPDLSASVNNGSSEI